jgi:hypothetical protein
MVFITEQKEDMDYKYLIVRAEDFSSIDSGSYYLEPRFNKDKTLVLIQPIEPPRDNFITHEEALQMTSTPEWEAPVNNEPDENESIGYE